MRVCVYCRVGNAEQLDGMAMNAQRSKGKRFAEDKGWQIVKEVCEYGVGTAMTRPGLQEVAELVRDGQVDLVLIQNLSRLSRRKQEADAFLNLLHLFNQIVHLNFISIILICNRNCLIQLFRKLNKILRK